MAKKQKQSIIDNYKFQVGLKIASVVVSLIIIFFAVLTFLSINNDSFDQAPNYLIWIFVASGLMSIFVFLKNRNRINLLKCIIMLAFNVSLGVIVLFAANNPFLFSLTAGLYCINIILGCILNIIQNRTIRSTIFNILIVLFAVAMGVGMLVSPIQELEQIQNLILIECIFIALVSFVEAASVIFSNLKVKILIKIILSTFSLEILFGLITMMVCFSIVFMKIEPNIETFPDALWYCFAIVTTIGFGDIVAITPIGRLLSAILGIYGIIVVAVITSIVVNFYNETSGKHDQSEFKEIIKEEKKHNK